MKKQSEPNLHFKLKSAITALRLTYMEYKEAIIDDLHCSWYSDDGELTFLSGIEERKKKITELGKEVSRLKTLVDIIKLEIIADEESE